MTSIQPILSCWRPVWVASKREIPGSTPSRCAMPHSSSPLARSISAASASAAGNPKRGRPAVIQQVIPQIVHVDPRHAVSFSHATFQTLRREYASYGRTRCRALAMAAAASMPTTLTLPLKAESDDNHQIPRKAKRTRELGRLWRISMQSWSI